MSANYKSVADAMWPDIQTWLVSAHGKEIRVFYERHLSEYLTQMYGDLTPAVKRDIIKYLMRNIIIHD